MSDARPLPEYGEYATPEQQAAAMGRVYVPPPDPATRVSLVEPPSTGTPAPRAIAAQGNLLDRFITIFQLGIGLMFLLISDPFHVAESTNALVEKLGISQRLPLGVDHFGWVLLTLNIVFLLLTFVWAYATLHRGRLAFYIPVVGYLAFSLVAGGVIGILL